MVNYTQLFDRVLLPMGSSPEFPLDILSPDLEKELKSQPWPKSSRGMIYCNQPIQGIEFVTEGDYIIVPMWGIAGASTTIKEVEVQIETKINDYCMEMIQCEQRYSFPSNRKNRIIVNLGVHVHKDNTRVGGYYGWDEVGFLILRK